MKSYFSTLKKIWGILTTAQRRSVVGLVVLMVFGMALETVGVGIIMPALLFLSQATGSGEYPTLDRLLVRLGNPSDQQIAVGGMIVLIGTYAIKGAFLAFLAWRRARFAYATQADLSERLFAMYLRQPWPFHLQRNSAQLIRNAITETNQFTSLGLIASMTLVSEGLVVFGIGALLLWVEPLAALIVVGALITLGFTFTRLTRAAIARWGTDRLNHEGLRIQYLQEGLGGAKDVKLLGREEHFIRRFRIHNDGSGRVSQNYYALQEMPRLIMELLGVVGLSGLVIVLVMKGLPMEAVVPTIGLFAAAAFRMMPSANRILNAFQNLRYVRPVIENLESDLSLAISAPTERTLAWAPFSDSIVLDNITYRYPETDAAAIQDVSLCIPRGASAGIIGSSGGGKSTLIDVLLGLLPPEKGSVRVDGVDIATNMRGWQRQIGYVPQVIFLSDDTLRRNVAFGLADDDIDDHAVARALKAAQLESFVAESPQGVNSLVGERGVRLSGGQRQRIGIARALYHDPAVLVLDEATSSLDGATEEDLMRAVNALHGVKTIVIVAHRLSTVADCDLLFRVEKGRVSVPRQQPVLNQPDFSRP
jgi:ATP-binding cassette, subfamily B, bacterial PglK